MLPSTYYVVWPDGVITVIVVSIAKNGGREVQVIGRRDRFDVTVGKNPFPTTDAALQTLARRMGVTIKKR